MTTTLPGAVQVRDAAVERWSRPLFEAFVAGAWMLHWTDDTLYWIAKPKVHRDPEITVRRLHCADGPALESDIENLYFWRGVLVPAFVVVRPDWITLTHIQTEQNAEVRRVMLERYGFDRYLLDSNAALLHEDEFGRLYGAAIAGDEPLVMIRVTNSTPELDGSAKEYALRVPPNIERAKQAVAWSFGLTEDEYQPAIET